jgi:hypothetical protein
MTEIVTERAHSTEVSGKTRRSSASLQEIDEAINS